MSLIAVVVPSLEQGGGVQSVAEFVYQTIQHSGKFDVRLISLSTSAYDKISLSISRPASWFNNVRTQEGIWQGRPMIRVGSFASELEFQRYKPRRVLAELLVDCDLIQVVCGSPAWAWAVCGHGKPVAVQCATRAIVERRRRDAMAHGYKAAWRRWMTQFTDRLDCKALQTVDAIQVENPWMLDYALGVNEGRDAIIRYAPPGVDAGQFRPALNRDLQADPYILCVGRLDDPRKNIELLLSAYSNLPVTVKESVRLVLAGSAGPSPAFWARVDGLGLTGRVEFILSPDSEALIRLYQTASVFALSSDEEGLGVVILEAMACGIPVVSTRCGGPEGIITDGKEGFLVGMDDPKAFADRLARLLSDDTLNGCMGVAARETIIQRYEAGVTGQAFLDIYDELLIRHRL